MTSDLTSIDASTMNLFRSSQLDGRSNTYGLNIVALLGRDAVVLQSPASRILLKDCTILVTGAVGSIGSELCHQLLDYEPARIIGLDNNETGLFYLTERLHALRHGQCFQPRIGDITDRAGMEHLFARDRPQIVFHVAAYKHVPLLEEHPDQAIQTNVLATYHLCSLARKYRADRFVFVSTDKAADPTSVMGASKRFGELIIRSLGSSGESETCFCAVRFGNVIGSRGSVVPTFAQQIAEGGPVTITDPDATRYFMTILEACNLVILSAALAECGCIYLLDMGKPIRIKDLALEMIQAYKAHGAEDIPIMYIGLRPGERLHEVLVAADEKLSATAHGKIQCVTSNEQAPPPAIIAEWIQILNRSLLDGKYEQLRHYIFKFVRQWELVGSTVKAIDREALLYPQ